MKTNYDCIHLPAGATVEMGATASDLIDVGVIPSDTETQLNITYDTATVQGSKGEVVLEKVSNMQAELTTELYQINLENINRMAGGIMNLIKVPGDKVSGAIQEVPSFEKGVFIPLEHQNGDGSEIVIASVANGETPLTEVTDYIVMKSGSVWGLLVLDSSTATGSNGLKITYEYTPTAHIRATMGAGSIELKSCVVRIRKEVDGKKFQVTLYKAIKSDGITFSFPSVDSEDITSLPVTMQGKLDTSRALGDQLLEIIDEIGVA